jgi:hypothetical protein
MMVNYVELARKAAMEYQQRTNRESIASIPALGDYEKNELNEKSLAVAGRQYELNEINEKSPAKPGVETWWRIFRDGEPLCVIMQPSGLTRIEALKAASDKWPGSKIEVKR